MENKNKPSLKWAWSLIMIFIYLCVAVLLIFTPLFEHVALWGRVGMAALFFIYGLFRAYRLWRTF